MMRRLLLSLILLLGLGSLSQAAMRDYAQMSVTAVAGGGTGTLTLTTVSNFQSFAGSGAVDGETVSYQLHNSGSTIWEMGRGVVGSSGTTLTRGPVSSSSGGAAVTATAGFFVFITPLASDMITTQYPNLFKTSVAEKPCAVSGTSGTITLDLSTCTGPSSPDVFHIGPLTGTSTIAFTNPTVGQVFRLEIAANTQTVTLPNCVGPSPPIAVAGNSFIVYDVFDTGPTYWCPSGVQPSLVGSWTLLAHAASTSTSTTATIAATNTTGADLLVLVTTCAGTPLTIGGSPSQSWSNAVTSGTGAGVVNSAISYVQAPTTSSTQTVTVTCSGASSGPTAELLVFSGSIASPLDATGSATATGTTVQPSATSTVANEIAVTGFTSDTDPSTLSINQSFSITDTVPYSIGVNYAGSAAWVLLPTAGVSNPTWTATSSSNLSSTIATFK